MSVALKKADDYSIKVLKRDKAALEQERKRIASTSNEDMNPDEFKEFMKPVRLIDNRIGRLQIAIDVLTEFLID